ncbi:MAG: hypothetical protein RLZ10_182 [Bacteroidota bacterium]
MNHFQKYCLLNEIDLNRINLPKNPATTELHKNEAQFFISENGVSLERNSQEIDLLRLNFFIEFTNQVIKHFNLNINFRCLVNLNDGPENDSTESRLCFARPRKSVHICIPDSHMPRTANICSNLTNIDKPFNQKINKACFFGSDTGRKFLDGEVQRTKFCKKLKQSELVVAKITNFIEQPFQEEIYSKPVSIQDQLNYRFILNINGNTTSWERLIWAMKSNSFCLFLKPPPHQDEISWYYHIFDLSQYFITVDENSIENFIEWADDWRAELESFNEHQKILGNTLAKPDFHAHYYAQVLLNYNQIYNESAKHR